MQTEQAAEIVSDSEAAAEVADSQTAGAILAQERQRLGLNEKEVADQLHITMHYVKALESNNYEKLPGAVFAKGYLKSYAELLGLDVEDLLARFDVINDQRQAEIQEASRQVRARKKKDRNKPLVIISLLIFVGGFLGLWLVNSFFGADVVTQVPATVEANGSVESTRPTPPRQLATQAQLSLQAEPEAQALVAVESTSSQEGQPESVATAASLLVDTANVQAAVEPDLELQDIAAALQATAPVQAAVEPTPSLSTIATAAEQPRVISIESAGDDVLRMSFTGESWVEVNDSESQQIYRDIREAGDVLEITGSAPFNILLGDAPFTRLSLNGDEIDLSSDIRIDNSARLTVGL